MNISLGNLPFNGFKVKRQKFGIGSLLFMLLFGAVFTVAGFFLYKSTLIDESWTRAQGKVVAVASSVSDGSTTYAPTVQYKVDGQPYSVTSSMSSSSYPSIGSSREVAYNPARPDQAKVVEGMGAKLLTLIFPVVGVAFLIVAPILYIKSLRRSRKISNLVQTGYKQQGVLVDIQSTGANDGRGTYKIVVAAPDSTGVVQNYVSDGLNGAASLSLADFQNNPIPIDVYIDPSNPQNYYVDLSDIPNLTPQRIGELIKSAATSQQYATTTPTQLPNTVAPDAGIPTNTSTQHLQ